MCAVETLRISCTQPAKRLNLLAFTGLPLSGFATGGWKPYVMKFTHQLRQVDWSRISTFQ
jgi:hypothetical protein